MVDFPDDTQRLTILGRTGSGKTQAGLWHLSRRSISTKPWVIIDFKRDKTIRRLLDLNLERFRTWDFNGYPPRDPGVYVIQPVPETNDDIAVNHFLYHMWTQENIGLYVDEGTMIGRSKAFKAILTQGRDKHIPVITVTQRPFDLTTYVWSESEFFQIFALQFHKDFLRLAEFSSVTEENVRSLPEFYSIWYQVAKDRKSRFLPVDPYGKIQDRFRDRLAPKEETAVEAPAKRNRFHLL